MKRPLAFGFLFLFQVILAPPVMAGGETAAGETTPGRHNPVIFPPFAEDLGGQNLALGIADRAASELFETGKYNHLHLKQVFAMARSHNLTSAQLAEAEPAEKAARILGADTGTFGSLEKAEDGTWKLSFTAFDLRSKKSEEKSVTLPADTAAAVQQGGRDLAGAIVSLHGFKLTGNALVHPQTGSDKAMDAYLSCYRVIINQSMGLRKSHVIEPSLLIGARDDCRQAVKIDPAFSAGWAALSLIYSLSFKKEDAARALEHIAGVKGYLAYGRIAKYWWTTRFENSAAGAEVLSKATADYPGSLIFLTYLGEHLNITRDYDKALAVWNQFLELVPDNPYAMAQKGYSLARLAKLNDSIDITTKACKADPDSMDLALELASRLVDAEQLMGAESILLPLAGDKRVYGEVLLRLGYVYLLQKKDELAEKYLQKALKLARGPHEWRTRGRTRYDLAIIMARAGRLEEAEQQLLRADWEGFTVQEVLKNNADLQVLAERPKVAHLFKNATPRRTKLRLHTTPFPVDYSGQIVPDAKRTPPPSMTGVNF